MSVATDGLNDVYESLERYNWDDDVEFQSGLSAILGSNSSPEQASELALRARCFYYARYVFSAWIRWKSLGSIHLTHGRKYNINIDFDSYKAYRNARNRPPLTPPPTNGASPPPVSSSPGGEDAVGGIMPAAGNPNEPPAPYPTSFAHIVELITSGQPVPGIKEIAPTVLTGQGTQPEKAKRRKPWEKEDTPAEATQTSA